MKRAKRPKTKIPRGRVLESERRWPAGYVDSIIGVPKDFEMPPQGEAQKREDLD